MNLRRRFFKNSTWIFQTLVFFKTHVAVILTLGLIAAFGRAAQLRAFGEVTPVLHHVLEFFIQSARIGVFIYTLGLTNVKKGISRILSLIASKAAWKHNLVIARAKVSNEWDTLLVSLVIYSLITLLINLLIDYATYQTCLYYKLKATEIISNVASEWVLILFLKNLSVIPFTLVFNALFLLWATNKISLTPARSKL
jgi:hypothetical protein